MTTDPISTIRERLGELRAIRARHVQEWGGRNSKQGEPQPFYRTGDSEAEFTSYTDMQHYERLTGHIDELEYLLRR